MTCRLTSASPPSRTSSPAPGFLGSAYGPFSLGADPADGGFKVRDLNLPGGVDDKRLAERRQMRAVVDEHFSALEKSDALDGMDSFYQRAYAMISSDKARAAFDLGKEPDQLRDDYGRNAAGQRMLLARRLVESGVRFVSLTYGGWDHHDNIKNGVTSEMPAFDQAFAALIRDLEGRGMLDSHAGDGHDGIRAHAQDQRHGRPRSLSEGLQHRDGRRRH